MPTKLFVGNLPAACSEDAVRDLFTSYGDITELAMRNNYAFVHFKKEEDAATAVRDLNGTKMLGKQINVEISTSKKTFNADRKDNHQRDNHQRDNHHRDNYQRDNHQRDNHPRRDFHNNQNHNFNRDLDCGPLPNNFMAPNILAQNAMDSVGILSAVKQLAAVAERERTQISAKRTMEPPREQLQPAKIARNDRDEQQEGKGSKNSGFVIYERYYVDPTHPLLKGLPIPQLPNFQDRRTDSLPSQNRLNNSDNCGR